MVVRLMADLEDRIMGILQLGREACAIGRFMLLSSGQLVACMSALPFDRHMTADIRKSRFGP